MTGRRIGSFTGRLLRTPTRLYDWHLGFLLGRRFLRLSHVGRRTGQVHETMLEVVGRRPADGEFVVLAGLGRSAQWFRNISTHEAVEVAVGRDRFQPVHRVLGDDEAVEVLADYERSNRLIAPVVRRVLSWLVGWTYDSSEQSRRRLVGELPLVAFRPADPDGNAR